MGQLYEDLQTHLELASKNKKGILSFIEEWNANVESQDIPGITDNFGIGVQKDSSKRLAELCQENLHTAYSKHPGTVTQE